MKLDIRIDDVDKNLFEGEGLLEFLSQEIQNSSRISIGLFVLFTSALKAEQNRYGLFQIKYAAWVRDNFNLRRKLLLASDDAYKQRKGYIDLLESEAKTVTSLFDSWEDAVEGHERARTDILKVTIPMVAVIISMCSLIIALMK